MSSGKQQKTLTTDDCKKILFKVGIKFGVSPKLISERLLDAQDKCDMLNGEIPIEYLEVAVKAWQDAGMPDYASGLTAPMVSKTEFRNPQTLPEPERHWQDEPLNAPFVRHSEPDPEPETA
jgi:hypothetical protein